MTIKNRGDWIVNEQILAANIFATRTKNEKAKKCLTTYDRIRTIKKVAKSKSSIDLGQTLPGSEIKLK